MTKCPNINSPEAKAIIDKVGLVQFFRLYKENGEEIPKSDTITPTLGNVDYSLKVMDVLMQPKTSQLYNKFYAQNPAKFYSELQVLGVPKQQIQMLKDWNASNPTSSLDEMISGIGAQFLYPVEVQVSGKDTVEKIVNGPSDYDYEEPEFYSDEDDTYSTRPETNEYAEKNPDGSYNVQLASTDGSPIHIYFASYQAMVDDFGKENADYLIAKTKTEFVFTSHYARLAVPGGTNYRENEIKTPFITPSIKGHAQFATNEGIGWFRSDDKVSEDFTKEKVLDGYEEDGSPIYIDASDFDTSKGTATKTRRILELQSDLFQKGRDNKTLTTPDSKLIEDLQEGFQIGALDTQTYNESLDKLTNETSNPQNQFLQLLNKDGNWINFFIKSIVNDSIKRDYEEVWFPSGQTAAKIEGHTAIADRIKGVDDQIKMRQEDLIYYKETNDEDGIGITEQAIRSLENEKAELKSQGLEKLAPIEGFYENRVKNILQKTYPSTEVTDEYGNKWNKVDLKNIKPSATKILFNRMDTKASFEKRAIDLLRNENLIEQDSKGNWIVNKKSFHPSLEAIDTINESYYQIHGFRPYAINKTGNRTIVITPESDMIELRANTDPKATSIAKQLMAKLSEKLGIQGEIISSVQASEMSSNYNNEPAFFFNGKVYIVQDNLNVNNVLHEFSHPFIATLRVNNPSLYNKLYNEFASSDNAAIKDILRQVRENYPEFSEDSNEFKDEVLVRILTANAERKLEGKTGLSGVFANLWFGIKQALRKIFGQKVKLDNLNENTTLDQLSDMLLMDHVELNKDYDSDIMFFNRELGKELESLDDHVVIKHIGMVGKVLSAHVSKLKENANYKELQKVLENDRETNVLMDSNELIQAAQKLQDDINEKTTMMQNFAQSIVGISIVSKKMRDYVDSFNDRGMTELEQLRVLIYYGYMIKEWNQTFDDMQKDNPDLPLLKQYVTETLYNFKKITDYSGQIFSKGLVQVMREQLEPIRKEVMETYPARIKQLEDAIASGNRDSYVVKSLANLEKEYKRFNLDDDTILEYLHGKMGDTNWFSALVESPTTSPDPIASGFAAIINKSLYTVESNMQLFSTRFRAQLADLYADKALNIDRSNPEVLGKQLTFIDKVFSLTKRTSKAQSGEPEAIEVHTLLNEHGNGWQYDYKWYEDQIERADRAGDKEKIREIRKEFNQFKADYFHREYKEEVYEARKFWWKDDMHERAYNERKAITDKIRSYQSYTTPLSQEIIDEIDSLRKQLQNLASTRNIDGTEKVDDPDNDRYPLTVAKLIKEYQQLSRNLYEETEIKGAFHRAMQAEENLILDEGIVRDSPEFNKRMTDWVNANTRTVLTQKFYDDKKAIFDSIKEIMDRLPKDVAIDEQVTKAWDEIFDQIKGYKDKDGQPMGTEMTPEKLVRIKTLQEQINLAQEQLRVLNNFTLEEQARMDDYFARLELGTGMTNEEELDFDALMDKQNAFEQSTKADRIRLQAAFQKLKALQSKIPTDYYLEVFNEKVKEVNPKLVLSMQNSELLADNINYLLINDSDFKTWFQANHILKSRWNAAEQSVEEYYERSYAWNRVIPNDTNVLKALASNNYKELLALKSPYMEVKWHYKYYFNRVKNNKRIPRVVGVTVDNRGQWLPRTREQTILNKDTPEQIIIPGAKTEQDGVTVKYENKRFFELKNSTAKKDQLLFKMLEIYKKNFLELQEGAMRYTKLWYEIPRVRKTELEIANNTLDNPKGAIDNVVDRVKNAFSKKSQADALDSGQISPEDLNDENKLYVATDLFGREIPSIPMKYMSKIESQHVSLDVGRSILKYAAALKTNQMMHEVNPIAQALEQTLKDNPVENLNKIALAAKWTSQMLGSPKDKDESTRLKAVRNMMERYIHGIESKMELGLLGNKVASHMMGLAAFGALAINITAGIKNVIVARVNNVLESINQKFFTIQDWKAASSIFFSSFLPAFYRDYNGFANKSLQTQQFELFDPIQGDSAKEIGEEFSASKKKDMVDLRFMTSPQKLGELNAQGSAFIAMMKNQKVPVTVNGQVVMMSYLDVWELKEDKTIGLISGADPAWDRTGKEFLAFKYRLHEVNQLIQGAYAKMNQAEIGRFTSGKLLFFMRRYFVPGASKRFASTRVNVALGTITEGHYQSFAKVMMDTALHAKKNWHLYSSQEKRNALRTLAELGYSLTFLLLISLLGYNDNDPDKNEKLKNQSWAHNMLLYELMMIKGETETFLPIPGMGMNELLRMKDQPSIAFPIINKYYKTAYHAYELFKDPFTDEDLSHYQKRTGIHEKGDLKIVADAMKIFGYNGTTADPRQGVINYNATMNRYN